MTHSTQAFPKRKLPVAVGAMSNFTRDPVACMRALQKDHGDLVALRERVGEKQLIFAFGSEYNRQLLSRPDEFHSQFFAIRGSKKSAQRRLTSELLSMNGDEHSEQRRLLMSAFQRRAIPSYLNMVRQYTSEMLDQWRLGETVDLADEMTRLMLKMTSSILFGMQDEEFACKLGAMMETWVGMNHELGMAAFVSNADYFPKYQELLDYAEQLEANVRVLIAQRESAASENGNDVLSLLIKARQHGARLTDDQMIGQTSLLFAAAHMTTSHSLSWTQFLLAQHPEIYERTLEEVRSQDGVQEEFAPPGNAPAVKGGTRTLLDCVIRESMRILPASAYSQRICSQTVTLDGVTIPVGSVVVFSQFMTHRDERIYQDAARFNPDRWQSIQPSAYEYLPFGGGSRMCIGAPLATAIIQTVLPMILDRFHLAVEPNARVDGLVVSTMLSPTNGIAMRVMSPNATPAASVIRGNILDLVEFDATTNQRSARAA
jgi:cytochrome P450